MAPSYSITTSSSGERDCASTFWYAMAPREAADSEDAGKPYVLISEQSILVVQRGQGVDLAVQLLHRLIGSNELRLQCVPPDGELGVHHVHAVGDVLHLAVDPVFGLRHQSAGVGVARD